MIERFIQAKKIISGKCGHLLSHIAIFNTFLLLLGLGSGEMRAQRPNDLSLELIEVFKQGERGYHTFRIPALLALPGDRMLAFAEGRKLGRSDAGDIDLVMKVSEDGGQSWGDLQIVWDDADNTCGNPAPVWDSEKRRIALLATWNLGSDKEPQIISGESQDTRRVFYLSSDDLGRTWSTPRQITDAVKEQQWTWYATGPGSGIQLKQEKYKGRLMVACDHIEAETERYYSHIIYSDDHGATWQLGGSTPRDQVNECEVVELPGGLLMLNMRNYDRSQSYRQVAYSYDAGHTWESQQFDTTLVEPICQASLHYDPQQKMLLFSNPADPDQRVNMTLRFSFDYGYSWPTYITLHKGPSAYSDLSILGDGSVGCLFECGTENPYERIVFVSIEM